MLTRLGGTGRKFTDACSSCVVSAWEGQGSQRFVSSCPLFGVKTNFDRVLIEYVAAFFRLC